MHRSNHQLSEELDEANNERRQAIAQSRRKSAKCCDVAIGTRVQAHPATDAWMQGDQYGNVTAVGPKYVSVQMDRSGRVRKFAPRDLMPVR